MEEIELSNRDKANEVISNMGYAIDLATRKINNSKIGLIASENSTPDDSRVFVSLVVDSLQATITELERVSDLARNNPAGLLSNTAHHNNPEWEPSCAVPTNEFENYDDDIPF